MARRDQLNGKGPSCWKLYCFSLNDRLQKENLMSTCKKLLLQIVMAPQQLLRVSAKTIKTLKRKGILSAQA
nr:hypothetical protein [Mycoplasmopsis bovis]